MYHTNGMASNRDQRGEPPVFTQFISDALTPQLRMFMISAYMDIQKRVQQSFKPEDVQVVLKGGHASKLMSKPFDQMITGTQDLVQYLLTMQRYIWRTSGSDLDFCVYINPGLQNFVQVYQHVEKIVYWALLSFKTKEDTDRRIQECVRQNMEQNKEKLLDEMADARRDALPVSIVGLEKTLSKLVRPDLKEGFQQLPNITPSAIYLTVNRRVAWKSSRWSQQGKQAKNNAFCLMRIKLNLRVKRGAISENIPGELIDVSIPLQDDSTLNHFFRVSRLEHDPYTIQVSRSLMTIRVQSVKGLISEIVEMYLTDDDQGSRPWERPKCKKRLARLAFLVCLHFFWLWLKENKRESYQKNWTCQPFLRGLFNPKTYQSLAPSEIEPIGQFKKEFETHCLMYKKILDDLGMHANRTVNDKALKEKARRYFVDGRLTVDEWWPNCKVHKWGNSWSAVDGPSKFASWWCSSRSECAGSRIDILQSIIWDSRSDVKVLERSFEVHEVIKRFAIARWVSRFAEWHPCSRSIVRDSRNECAGSRSDVHVREVPFDREHLTGTSMRVI